MIQQIFLDKIYILCLLPYFSTVACLQLICVIYATTNVADYRIIGPGCLPISNELCQLTWP